MYPLLVVFGSSGFKALISKEETMQDVMLAQLRQTLKTAQRLGLCALAVEVRILIVEREVDLGLRTLED